MNQPHKTLGGAAYPGPLETPPVCAVKPDMVNKPPHYQGKVECIDAIEAAVAGLAGIEAHCTANAIKYLWRWKKKGGTEDLRKSIWYINRMLNEPRPTVYGVEPPPPRCEKCDSE